MKYEQLQPENFAQLLPFIVRRDTSSDPTGWSEANPLYGHCAVAALVAQNLFGGDLLRASLADYPQWRHLQSHYWNRLPGGREIDFTCRQFGDDYPTNLSGELRSRTHALGNPNTVLRYGQLAYRLAQIMASNAPIFTDEIFAECFKLALSSSCQKMKVGCTIWCDSHTDDRETSMVASAWNQALQPLADLCQPTCVRLDIKPRIDPMIGECAHAEELALWRAVKKEVRLDQCDLYVTALTANGLAKFQTEPEFTCLRCAVQIYHAGIRSIVVPLARRWHNISPYQAVRNANLYATGQKSV